MLNLVQRSWNLFRIGRLAVAGRRASDQEKKQQAQKYLMELLGNSRGLPTKIGQFLALKEDSPELAETLAVSLSPLPFDEVEPVLNRQFGNDYRTVFKKIEIKGIPASLGQVHFGVLRDGRKVAVKVRYPGIEESVRSEMKLLGWLPGMGPVKRWGIDWGEYVDQLSHHFERELDYRLEAERQSRYRELAEDSSGVVIPEVFAGLSGDAILVQSLENGAHLDKVRKLGQEQKQAFGEILLKHTLFMLFRRGLMHSDPNPNNFAFRASKTCPQVVLYDFGSLFEVNERERLVLLRIILALRKREPIDSIACLAELGFDIEKLQDLGERLPGLLQVLFEPFIVDDNFDLADWNLNARWDAIAGELKWWFRSAAPPRMLFLMRSLHGIASHLKRLDASLCWRWILVDVAAELYPEAGKLTIAEIETGEAKHACGFQKLAEYLKVEVDKGENNHVFLTMPSRVVDQLGEVIDPRVLDMIKKENIDLKEVQAKVQQSGYATQTLFEVEDPVRRVRVWLE